MARRIVVPMVLVISLVVACSSSDVADISAQSSTATEALTTTSPTSTATSTTTTLISSTTTQAPRSTATSSTASSTTRPELPDPDARFIARPGLFPPPPLAGGDGARGSGCGPGTETLPDGVWFGLLPRKDTGTVELDLACFYFGDIAYEVGRDRDEEVSNDYTIVNDNPLARTVSLHPSAIVWSIPLELTPLQPVRADGGWPPPDEDVGFGACPGPSCLAWLYVNDGVVTEIVEQYVP